METQTNQAANPQLMGEDKWELRLYVAGKTTKSVAAIKNLNKLCEEYLKGKYVIEVIQFFIDTLLIIKFILYISNNFFHNIFKSYNA